MNRITFDFETRLIRPGVSAPKAIAAGFIVYGSNEAIAHWSECEPVLKQMLERAPMIVGHHIAFDMAVAAASYPRLQPLIWEAYEQNRVTCTMRRAQLIDIFEGKRQGYRNSVGKWVAPRYGLEFLAQRYLGVPMSKGADSWQLRYSEVHHLMPSEWPEDAREYLLQDIRLTDRLYALQEHSPVALADQFNKARTMFAIQLMTVWGIRTNVEGVRLLEARTQQKMEELEFTLSEAGLIRYENKKGVQVATRNQKATKRLMVLAGLERARGDGWDAPAEDLPPMTMGERMDAWRSKARKDKTTLADFVKFAGTEAMQKRSALEAQAQTILDEIDRAREEKRAPNVPAWLRLTDTNDVSLDAEACEDTGEPLLDAYAEVTACKNTLSKDVAALELGAKYPIHSRFDVVATGRKSSSNPNIQNPGKRGGVRECFIPRPGYVFLQADFTTQELCTLAEYCMDQLGFSNLAKVLNAGEDPHCTLGAQLLGITYKEMVARYESGDEDADNARTAAKPGNFGLPGGMGVKSFIAFAKGYGVPLTHAEAQALKDAWHAAYTEMKAYFRLVNLRKDPTNPELYSVLQIRSNRIRTGAKYCAACNSPFQGLGADITDDACWRVQRACYHDRADALYGSRMVNTLHDELIVEAKDDPNTLHEAGESLTRHMVLAGEKFLKHVKLKTSKAVAMRVWSKGAHRVESGGRLIPWDVHSCACKKCDKNRKNMTV